MLQEYWLLPTELNVFGHMHEEFSLGSQLWLMAVLYMTWIANAVKVIDTGCWRIKALPGSSLRYWTLFIL